MPIIPKTIISSSTRTLCILGITLAGLSLPTSAAALPISDTFVAQDGSEFKVVINNKTPLRCGDQDVFYTITEMTANSILPAVGTSGSYTKVLLPATIGAFVPINEVKLSGDSKSVTLTVDSKLRAPSHLLGISGSWKAIYSTPLTTGTTLQIIETLANDAGAAVGYRVVAPTGPAGELPVAYIKTDALRDPTADEIATLTGTKAQPAAQPVIEPETNPEITLEITTEPEPAEELPTDQIDTSLLEEMNTESSQPVEIKNAAPVDAQNTPASSDPTIRTAPSGLVSASALEDLEAAFDAARALSKSELDSALDELFAEFTRTRANAQDDTSLAQALDQRLEWLDIRMETRDQRLAIALALAAYDANADQIVKDINAWQAGRSYQLVGKMVTSAIYTGEHLPLLYRIQATDPASGMFHTIGYVAPKPDQDFRHLLGRVVGVIGSPNNDESLMLSVIAPDRIEPMPE